MPPAKKVNANLLALKRQMDYYFGDKNYPKDKFLHKQASQSPTGHIPLQVFLAFNKIKELKASESDMLEAIQ